MGADAVLDLTEVDWPASLLRFNDALRSCPIGTILEVRIRDPRVVDSVKMIAHNSNHRITGVDQVNECFRICICKAEGPRPVSGDEGSRNE
jgi:TusA-related sulfurtransferase